MDEIVAAGFAAHQADDTKCADESKGVDRGVKEGRAKTFAAARDETEQGITCVRDGGVGEEPAHICLRERDEIADKNGKRGEHSDERAPTGHHRMPASRAMTRTETD